MRFSTFATSAVFFGAVAMAVPNAAVVYQTEVVTITSCGPEVTNCPGSATSAVGYPAETPVAVITTAPAEVPYPVETSAPAEAPAPVETPVENPAAGTPVPETPHGDSTAPVEAPYPVETPSGVVPYPVPSGVFPSGAVGSGYPILAPSGTGSYGSPANTSTPVSPTSPPVFEGAASIKSFSLFAVVGAAGALFLI